MALILDEEQMDRNNVLTTSFDVYISLPLPLSSAPSSSSAFAARLSLAR